MVVKTLNMENKGKCVTEYSKTYIKQSYEKNWNFENIKLTQEEQNGKFTEGYIFYEFWTNPKKKCFYFRYTALIS